MRKMHNVMTLFYSTQKIRPQRWKYSNLLDTCNGIKSIGETILAIHKNISRYIAGERRSCRDWLLNVQNSTETHTISWKTIWRWDSLEKLPYTYSPCWTECTLCVSVLFRSDPYTFRTELTTHHVTQSTAISTHIYNTHEFDCEEIACGGYSNRRFLSLSLIHTLAHESGALCAAVRYLPM